MYKLGATSSRTLTVWDSDFDCNLQADSILLWRQFVTESGNESTASISEIVEQNGLEIRKKLLEFIYNVATLITENPTTNHKFRDDFDYFWMTQFHSRPYTQAAEFNNLAKIFALVEVIKVNAVARMIIHSGNSNLIKVFASLAESLKIEMQVVKVKSSNQTTPWRTRIKRIVPRPLLAILAMVTQIKNSLSLGRLPTRQSEGSSISFFDYWYRFSPEVTNNKFGSQYWTSLVDHLDQTGVNWWHNLVGKHTVRELKNAKKMCNGFNQHNMHRHEIIDAKINLRIFFTTIFDHFKVLASSLPSSKYETTFTDPVLGVNFWPLLKREWLNSMRSSEALLNCLQFNRLESLLSSNTKQKRGIYQFENQPWEMALIYLWRKYNHGQLIGVAHATVRFWDLRLMSDQRQFLPGSKMPRPDLVAVNGPLARNSLIESSYLETEIVDVEALMYLRLAKPKAMKVANAKLTILVATDYLDSATQTQMKLLSEVVTNNPNQYQILLKPHWSQKISNLNIDAQVISGKQDLANFFGQADVLYCSAITSAAIDGICSGLPVIQCLDPMSFNLSPLRGSSSVQTVRTAAELNTALQQLGSYQPIVTADELLNLDASLTRWSKLLQS